MNKPPAGINFHFISKKKKACGLLVRLGYRDRPDLQSQCSVTHRYLIIRTEHDTYIDKFTNRELISKWKACMGVTNYLTPYSRQFLRKPAVAQLLKNFATFYGTRSVIAVVTTAVHWFLSSARSTESISPHPISTRSVLILSTHLRLCLPSGSFLQVFPFVLHILPISSSLIILIIRAHVM
jgi:hypothetical protein